MKNPFERKSETKDEKILPSDVRYALQYKEGKCNKEDIESLALSNFENEAAYLLFKSLRHDPGAHRALMEKYISSILSRGEDKTANKEALKDILTEELSRHAELEADGVKLAQISRQGFDLWQKKFQEIASQLSEDERNIFLLAHSTILGLDSFVTSFAKKNKALRMLIPSWIESKKDIVGYVLSFDDAKFKLEWLQDSFDRTNSVLVDDTINTGETIAEIKKYWTEDGATEPEVLTIVTK